MNLKILLSNLCVLVGLTCFGQATNITIDLTDFEIGDVPKRSIAFDVEGSFHRMKKDSSISFKISNLPTMVTILLRQKNRYEIQRIFWIEDTLSKLSGSIQSPELLSITPNYDQQKVTDQVEVYIKKRKNLKGELAFTKPYMVYLVDRAYRLDISYIRQIVSNVPADLNDFWAVASLKQFLADYKNPGYNPKTKQLTYLYAVNKENNREKVAFKGEKYTLLNFSSSGCGWSLKGIDGLLEIYEKNHKKLEIVSVWRDYNYHNWISAAKKRKNAIKWNSYLDENGAFFKAMHVDLTPTNVLLDKNGIVVEIWKGTRALEAIDKYLTDL